MTGRSVGASTSRPEQRQHGEHDERAAEAEHAAEAGDHGGADAAADEEQQRGDAQRDAPDVDGDRVADGRAERGLPEAERERHQHDRDDQQRRVDPVGAERGDDQRGRGDDAGDDERPAGADPVEERPGDPGHAERDDRARHHRQPDLPGLPAVGEQHRRQRDQHREPGGGDGGGGHRAAHHLRVADHLQRQEAVRAAAYGGADRRGADDQQTGTDRGDRDPRGGRLHEQHHPGGGEGDEHGADHVEPGAGAPGGERAPQERDDQRCRAIGSAITARHPKAASTAPPASGPRQLIAAAVPASRPNASPRTEPS